jgi:ribosomal protein S18 acetylase RimI-like enzyme
MCYEADRVAAPPSPALPQGCHVVDLAAPVAPAEWIATLVSAGIQVTDATWQADFASDPHTYVAGIRCGDALAGVSSLTQMPGRTPPAGLVSWVGIRPEFQGRRLGAALIAACLGAARARGLKTVFLVTDDHRVPAIRTYLRAGFRPCLSSWDWTHTPRWARLHRSLGMRPALCRDPRHAAPPDDVSVS